MQPGTEPAGTWLYDLTPSQTGDGISQTLTLYGWDGAGNRSEPISRTYQLDTVGPEITVTTVITEVMLNDYLPPPGGRAPAVAPPVLTGTSADGGGLGEIVVRLADESGNLSWQTAVVTGSEWAFTPELTEGGLYTLTVEGYDLAGNAGVQGDYLLHVLEEDQAIIGLVAVNDGPTPLGSATTFTATVTAGNNIVYTWDFGDGTTAVGAVVSHIYASKGTFTATVTAENAISSAVAETVVVVERPEYKLFLPVMLK